jgi:hypothetical protein
MQYESENGYPAVFPLTSKTKEKQKKNWENKMMRSSFGLLNAWSLH